MDKKQPKKDIVLNFPLSSSVSVFEGNIKVLGGMKYPKKKGETPSESIT